MVFQSFQAGNLKRLDFDFFRGLQSAVARRLYRFLDKRFFQRDRWEFDVKELAWEHVGLSRNYDAANLKRKLRPAITELEQCGYLRPLVEDERFLKVRTPGNGRWCSRNRRPDVGLAPMRTTSGATNSFAVGTDRTRRFLERCRSDAETPFVRAHPSAT